MVAEARAEALCFYELLHAGEREAEDPGEESEVDPTDMLADGSEVEGGPEEMAEELERALVPFEGPTPIDVIEIEDSESEPEEEPEEVFEPGRPPFPFLSFDLFL